MKLLCIIKGILESIINFTVVSGHNFIEEYSNKDIQVLKCQKCGYRSIAFFKGSDNSDK